MSAFGACANNNDLDQPESFKTQSDQKLCCFLADLLDSVQCFMKYQIYEMHRYNSFTVLL